ncbi:MAG: twin-arginine translocase TatA/TatE family subunit [Flavobacteriaceae bacterium]|jgi:sec-independent protein translocase protein TatA|nr:twin-arginine translocase TatA/TatE family subunit [Flavobacteriaceae bacterium]|tara:strand:+ start:36 stop:251 length:216 start_codon:yes stop_codon:yes gene_type:complete
MILSILPLAIGWPQIVIIVIVAFIIFGPVGIGKKLGNLIKGTGKGVKEFKKALNEEDKENAENKESKEGEE